MSLIYLPDRQQITITRFANNSINDINLEYSINMEVNENIVALDPYRIHLPSIGKKAAL